MNSISLGRIAAAILLLFATYANSQTEGPRCVDIVDPDDPTGVYTCTVNKRESAFAIPKDRPIFLPIEDGNSESFYFDLNENPSQNEKIKKIYRNDKEKNGPFDYCTDRYGCRMIKRGGDEVLDRTERDSALKEVERIEGEYNKEKEEMAKAAGDAKGIRSKDDVQGDMPKRVYEKHIEIITTEIMKDIPAIKSKAAEVVAKNLDYESNVIPAKKKERSQKRDDNQAIIANGREDLKTQSKNLEPVLADIEAKVGGDAASENDLKIAVSEAANRSVEGLESQLVQATTYSHDPETIEDQLKARSALYRMNGYSLQADRMAEMATQLHNFNSGNTLLYQGMKLSSVAVEVYGDAIQSLTPGTFTGYSYIVLLNTVASDVLAYPGVSSDIRDYFRIMARTIGTKGRSIGDEMQALETGWAIRDYAFHFVGGTVKLVSSIGELVLTPVSDTAVVLAMAIVSYEETWNAIMEQVPAFYEKIKSCPNAQGANDCASIIGEHALDIVGIVKAGVSGVQAGANLARAASAAARAEVTYLGKLAVTCEAIGIASADTFHDFATWLKKPFDPNVETGAVGRRQPDKVLEAIRGLRSESPELLGVDLFKDVPSKYRGNVWDIMEALPAAVKGDAKATNFISRFRPHPMEREPALRGYISLDLVPNNPSESPLRFLYKVQSDGTIRWMIKDTHR